MSKRNRQRSQAFAIERKNAKLAAAQAKAAPDHRPPDQRPAFCKWCQHIVRASIFEAHTKICEARVLANAQVRNEKLWARQIADYEGETSDGFEMERCKCGRLICLIYTGYSECEVHDVDWPERTVGEAHICDGPRDPADYALSFRDQRTIVILKKRIRHSVSKRRR